MDVCFARGKTFVLCHGTYCHAYLLCSRWGRDYRSHFDVREGVSPFNGYPGVLVRGYCHSWLKFFFFVLRGVGQARRRVRVLVSAVFFSGLQMGIRYIKYKGITLNNTESSLCAHVALSGPGTKRAIARKSYKTHRQEKDSFPFERWALLRPSSTVPMNLRTTYFGKK
ncbi:hypothetical protein J6590_038739 [Homalodisca vitripennis]|nr:hypothetical protein J6590_038739 [Homalodisca vitripennis]